MTTSTPPSGRGNGMHHRHIYLDGTWTPPTSTEVIDVIEAATETVIGSVPDGTPQDVDAAVGAARRAFPGWADTPAPRRAAQLREVADALERRGPHLAELITREVGTPIGFAHMAQVGLAVLAFRIAAEVGESYPYERGQPQSLVLREPFGVVAAITPWNYPLFQVAAKAAYALAAGNTLVLKPSEVAPLSVYALTEIMDEVGLPPGVFNLVSGTGPVVGQALAAHPDVDFVSFTGSTDVGRTVTRTAAGTIKRIALELGGKSPTVVLPDADLADVVPRAVASAFLNNGQTCCALTRLVVPRGRKDEVERAAREAAEATRVGDPLLPTTQLGPLVSAQQRERVRRHIRRAQEQGATLLTGGAEPPEGLPHGYYVRPTVLSDVTTAMDVQHEEVFGPVLVIEYYDDDHDDGHEDEAVALANATPYGLAAAVWSADRDRAVGVARRIRAGQVEVNGGTFNPRAPFGGYKQSGNGREHGVFGLEEFLETKSVQL
ncbi:3-succinoylsemialdehyde-pyridine dehydrogenase [Streptomyces hundungensis]|uniref:aldehyde dehydrogenase (NAD(+)) n=2 Tax=Streptomyces hundungensis TaxID=1077946 RepID=A0A387H4P7_9ACTN|nr:3-succinoylsemialdehyde-pyridine dehydrogenase [Streptomyces hundungensis]